MKKLIFTFFLFLFVTGIFSQETETVIYSCDFEDTPITPEAVDDGFDYGDLWVRCFSEDASWDTYVATGAEAISGDQSFCLNIIDPGSEVWGLQFILNRDQMALSINSNYRITFKIKSETPNNLIDFRAEGRHPFQQYYEIQEANVVEEVSWIMNTSDPLGGSTTGFKWFFGQITNVGKIWIDDISITLLPPPSLSSLSEDFNNVELIGNNLGDFELGTYAGSWDYGLEVDPLDINNKFLRLQPIEDAEWWAYQFRNLKYYVNQGQKYKVQFKAKSDVPNTIQFRLEAATGFQISIPLSGEDTFETVSFVTTPSENSGMVGVLWAFGLPTVVGSSIWIDDIVITEVIVPELIEISEDFETNTIDDVFIGDFEFGTYGDGIWDYAIEEEAGNKFLRMNIGDNPDWWAFQFKTSIYRTLKGKEYTATFKARSSVDNVFRFRAERNVNFDYDVELSASNDFESFTIDTSPIENDGVTNFIFGFGQPTIIGSVIDIDDIVIKPKSVESSIIPTPKLTNTIPVLFRDNRLEFPANLQANVQVYDLRGILVTQGAVGVGANTIPVKNDYRTLIVKITDNQGIITITKVLLSH